MPNFCPECGSAGATSRFCASCGFSLASTPSRHDARTQSEDVPAFRTYAPPVADTWAVAAAGSWSPPTEATTSPLVRGAVRQDTEDVSETKLAVLKWLWRVGLVATTAYALLGFASVTGNPVFSTKTPGLVLGLIDLVVSLAVTGVAAHAARQLGAKTPHPVLAILIVIGAAFAAVVLGWLISPEYWAGVEITDLHDKGLDSRFLYGLALFIQTFAFYVVAFIPVVALSNSLENRYQGEAFGWLGSNPAPDEEPSRFGWTPALCIALAIGAYGVVTSGVVATRLPHVNGAMWRGTVVVVFAPLFFWKALDFKTRSEIDAARAAKAATALVSASEPGVSWRNILRWTLICVGVTVAWVVCAIFVAASLD